ncbi:hypothetical protein NSE01_25090 [Novosphingobium sediminis]|uniref:Uncharacterized protein n=1 Tax=Novosphingobium sediminis TaxID=707214 RepID=A0A512AM31_9SPHN|nr:hypothetical protein NSE01_25090 [Novosphingobium sediminis]
MACICGLFDQAIDWRDHDGAAGFTRFVGDHAIGFPARRHRNDIAGLEERCHVIDFAGEADRRAIARQRSQPQLVLAETAENEIAVRKPALAKCGDQDVEALLLAKAAVGTDLQALPWLGQGQVGKARVLGIGVNHCDPIGIDSSRFLQPLRLRVRDADDLVDQPHGQPQHGAETRRAGDVHGFPRAGVAMLDMNDPRLGIAQLQAC